MPITSLVVSLIPEASEHLKRTCDRLQKLGSLELGQPQGLRLPVVVDADSYAIHDESLEALRNDPEVMLVDVVFHDFSDVTTFGQRPKRRRRRH